MAEVLDAIADHFEKLQKGEDVAESREDLRESEEETGIKEELDEQFAQAERLAELAQLSPEELLRELEEELAENQPMQKEVSEIAEDALADAQETLEFLHLDHERPRQARNLGPAADVGEVE